MNDQISTLICRVLQGYLECALWTEDCHASTKEFQSRAKNDIENFLAKINSNDLQQALDQGTAEYLGHNFWLTRNRHGAGFWDGRYSEFLGLTLTDLSHAQGEVNCEKFSNKLRLL